MKETRSERYTNGENVIICRNAGINELQNLKYLPRSSTEREILFEDRTHAHADHVGFGLDRQTTAAVGKNSILSSMSFTYQYDAIYICQSNEKQP